MPNPADAQRTEAEVCSATLERLLSVGKHPEWIEDFLPVFSADASAAFFGPRLRDLMQFAFVTSLEEIGDNFWVLRTTGAKNFIQHLRKRNLSKQYESHLRSRRQYRKKESGHLGRRNHDDLTFEY